MAAQKIANDIAQLWQKGLTRTRQVNAWTHGWLGMLVEAANQTLKPDSAVSAAAIAYFAIFSLFPIALLSVAIASFSLGALMDQHLIVQKLEFIAPALGQLLGKNIDEIVRARGPVTIVASVSLIWSASSIFYVLTGTLNAIWGIGRGRHVWKRRGLAILFVLIFAGPILFLASFADNLTASILTRLPDQIMPLVDGASLLTAVLLDIALFLSVYLILPHANSSWREVLPGAVAAGLLWEVAKKGFLSFVATYLSFSNLVYGSVAAVIAVMTWAYLSGLIFLFGAYLSVAYHRQRMARLKAAAQPAP
jgi:membrane protein